MGFGSTPLPVRGLKFEILMGFKLRLIDFFENVFKGVPKKQNLILLNFIYWVQKFL
jgi:hypothetical protein